jgi:hypothetical protein
LIVEEFERGRAPLSPRSLPVTASRRDVQYVILLNNKSQFQSPVKRNLQNSTSGARHARPREPHPSVTHCYNANIRDAQASGTRTVTRLRIETPAEG